LVVGTAKSALFDSLASVARALGNGRRAEIVDVLAQGERSVDELAGEIGQSVANTSQHLQVLSRAGLVESRRDGTRVIYRLRVSASTSCGARCATSPSATSQR
jgi:DNA-binding transcriptional ArsR family regulator